MTLKEMGLNVETREDVKGLIIISIVLSSLSPFIVLLWFYSVIFLKN